MQQSATRAAAIRNVRALAVLMGMLAIWATPARAISHPGTVEREEHAGRIVMHRAVCARDNRPLHMHCHAHVQVRADGSPALGKAIVIAGPPAGYAPADLRSAYRVTQTGSSGTLIAIVDAYGYPKAASDLATYRAQFGLPPCTTASGCFTGSTSAAAPPCLPPIAAGRRNRRSTSKSPARCAPIAGSC